MENKYEKAAAAFCDAIRTIAAKPDNLENLECYLSYHFGPWMEKYAGYPEGLTSELASFAEMDICYF